MKTAINSEKLLSIQKCVLPPPMQKIGIELEEIVGILQSIEENESESLESSARGKIREAYCKVHALSLLLSGWTNAVQSGGNVLTEEERARRAKESKRLKFLARMDKAIMDSMEDGNMNIEYLTDSLCMSRSTLYRRVKALTGISANEYIRRKKMEVAKELLLDSDMAVSEIAYKVGCSSMSYFRQTFKKLYGVIPSEYLKNLKTS